MRADRYYIVTGTGFRTHDFAWIRQNIGAGLDASLSDVTEQFGTLSLMGPMARAVLAAVTDADVSNEAFPFGALREIAIAGRPVRALRVTYVGELGWELHMAIGDTGEVFDRLIAAGAPHGIAPAGYRAIELLRLEKPYRAWGADITPNDNPFEAGLGWAVKLRSGGPFSAARRRRAPPRRSRKRLAHLHRSRSRGRARRTRNDLPRRRPVGYLASAGWGYTVGANIGLGYVRNADGVSDDFPAAGVRTGGRHRTGAGGAAHGPALRSGQRPGEGLTRTVSRDSSPAKAGEGDRVAVEGARRGLITAHVLPRGWSRTHIVVSRGIEHVASGNAQNCGCPARSTTRCAARRDERAREHCAPSRRSRPPSRAEAQ